MTLLVVSPDYASHLFPLLALAEPWARAGKQVVVATGPAVAPHVRRAGFKWLPLTLGRGSNAGVARAASQPAGEDANLRAFFDATRHGMIPTLRLQARLRLNDLLWQPLETARATLDAVAIAAPTTIMVDHLAFGARLGLHAAQLPYADVVLGHPTALPAAGERYGVPGYWPAAFEPNADEVAELAVLADEVAERFSDDWNRAMRQLNPAMEPVDDAFRCHGPAVIYNYPAALHPPARSGVLPPDHEFIGSAVRREALDDEVGSWLDRDADLPLLVVSFGSFLSTRSDILARVVAALRGTDLRVALACGSTDPRELGAVPDHWLVQPFLPQVALMRHAQVAITHGGNNGVTEALTYGVPVLALPFSTDQFAVAADLERGGVGMADDPNRASDSAIRRAVEELLGARFRGSAGELGQELRRNPGPSRALRHLDALRAVA